MRSGTADQLAVVKVAEQAHLTHVYAKLDLTCRAQLVQLAARRY
jgi:DNA-binding NarL/FixJ family response regulator